MTLRARFVKSYSWRYLLIIVMAFGWAAYCAYDGFLAYPLQLERAEAWEKLEGMADGPRSVRWKEISQEKGWADDVPIKAAKTWKQSISQQYWMGGISLLVGTIVLLVYISTLVSWIEETDSGLKTSWGQIVDFNTVTQLNKRKWRDKGIARAYYMEKGKKREFVFDDFKFEREPIGVLLSRLESKLTPDQIIGEDNQPNTNSEAEPESEAVPETKTSSNSESKSA